MFEQMKRFIENYKGWDISFIPRLDSFYCFEDEPYATDKLTYPQAKEMIDSILKDNEKFKTVWFKPKEGSPYNKTLKIIGQTKDGLFIHEDINNKKHLLSKHNENYYIDGR